MTIAEADFNSHVDLTVDEIARGLNAISKEYRTSEDGKELRKLCAFLDEAAATLKRQESALKTANDVLSIDPKPNLAADRVYRDALGKLKWNLQRGKDDKADYWSILAASLEELYGIQRPEHLRE